MPKRARSSPRPGPRWGLAALCALVLALALPAAASAKPGYSVEPPSLELFFFVEASNGYSVFVHAERPHRVELTVSGGQTTATYRLEGQVTDSRVKANLGALGRISMRFRPRVLEGGERFDDGRCEGRRATNEKGLFVGSFEFHGELDFADASATRSGGNRGREFRIVCRRNRRGTPTAPATTSAAFANYDRIAAAALAPGLATYFTALSAVETFKPGSTWSFGAVRRETGGRIQVTREVHVGSSATTVATLGPPGAVPATATVEPPPPFAGSAAFSGGPGLPSEWTGSLGVVFPGTGLIPLTGPGYSAALCRGLGEPEQQPCAPLLSPYY